MPNQILSSKGARVVTSISKLEIGREDFILAKMPPLRDSSYFLGESGEQ